MLQTALVMLPSAPFSISVEASWTEERDVGALMWRTEFTVEQSNTQNRREIKQGAGGEGGGVV